MTIHVFSIISNGDQTALMLNFAGKRYEATKVTGVLSKRVTVKVANKTSLYM